jgi:anti-sigma factor RsiW
MKDREYYERLISDSLDRELSQAETEELKQALQRYPDLAQFQQEVMKQAEILRSLPEFSTPATLRLSRERVTTPGFLRSLWNRRVSVPLPIAALLLLAFMGVWLLGMFANPLAKAPVTKHGLQGIEYVQIERLKPATAVLIQQNEIKN